MLRIQENHALAPVELLLGEFRGLYFLSQLRRSRTLFVKLCHHFRDRISEFIITVNILNTLISIYK